MTSGHRAAGVLLGGVMLAVTGTGAAQSGVGMLHQLVYVKASNAGVGDQFGAGGPLEGNTVALSADGTTLAVGAPIESGGAAGINGNEADDSLYAAGAVYVYVRDGDFWTQQAYLKASHPGLGDYFGFKVALSGDGSTLAVSAVYEASAATGIDGEQSDDSTPQAGAVYVFTRAGTTWSQQAYIKSSNNGLGEAPAIEELSDGDQFGFSIALSDDGGTLAVGAIGEASGAAGVDADQRDNAAPSAGAAYVFRRAGGAWSQSAYLKPSNPTARDYFGYAIALSADGTTLAVGSYDEDGSLAGSNARQDDDMPGSGAVYVFDHGEAGWAQTAYVKAGNGEPNDSFGVAVTLSDDGNTLVASSLDEDGMSPGTTPAPAPDWESDTSTGAAYVFTRDGAIWIQRAYLKASNTGQDDWFGSGLALSGDGSTLAVGAALEDGPARGINGAQHEDTAHEAGAAYLFTRDGEAWTQIAYIKSTNSDAYDEFGCTIALSRDGRTLAIGARGEDSAALGINGDQSDNTAQEAGAVYLFERR